MKTPHLGTNLINLYWLKPLKFTKAQISSIKKSKFSLIVESGYEICGTARSISYELNHITGRKIYALGMKDAIPGAAKYLENGTPTQAQIINKIKELLKKN